MGNANLQFIKPAGQVSLAIVGLADVWGHIKARLSHNLPPEGGLCALCSPKFQGYPQPTVIKMCSMLTSHQETSSHEKESASLRQPQPSLIYSNLQAGFAGFMM